MSMFTNTTNPGFVAQELSDVLHGWVGESQNDLGVGTVPESNITFNVASGSEMLRVAEDGFYVRGVKVPVDDKEAATVYRVFREWLTWAQLTRD